MLLEYDIFYVTFVWVSAQDHPTTIETGDVTFMYNKYRHTSEFVIDIWVRYRHTFDECIYQATF
jgi:hypothetical protein